jgi:hypothetical protein
MFITPFFIHEKLTFRFGGGSFGSSGFFAGGTVNGFLGNLILGGT